MITTYLHRCMIVPDAYGATVRALCNGMASGGAGSNMFLTALSPTGALPATHWISCGMQGDDFCGILPLTSFDVTGVATTAPGQPATVVYLAGQAGITVTQFQIEAIFAAVEVTTEVGQVAIARRGLQMIQGTL